MRNPGAIVRLLIKVAVSAGLLAFLVSRMSLAELVRVARGVDPWMMSVASLVFFVSNVLGSFQWHGLLRASGVSVTWGQSFRFYFVGLFFNNFLPANIGGDAVKVYDVTRVGSNVYQVIAVTILDRLIGIFSLCLLATMTVLGLMLAHPIETQGLYLFVFLLCMVPPLFFYLVEPLSSLLRRLVSGVRALSLDERGRQVLDYMGHFKGRRPLVARLVLLSFAIQALRVWTHILVAQSLGVPVGSFTVAMFFVFVPLLSLAMIPPITINGLGIREALGIVLFAQAGIGQADAFTIEFLTYVVSICVSLLGLIFFLSRRAEGRSAAATGKGGAGR